MDKFIDFADYLKRDKRNDFYISLKEIEEIIGQSLCRSAYVHPTYWSTSSTHRFALVIEDCGFKVRPDLANERIRLIRISKADESLDDGLLDDDELETVYYELGDEPTVEAIPIEYIDKQIEELERSLDFYGSIGEYDALRIDAMYEHDALKGLVRNWRKEE